MLKGVNWRGAELRLDRAPYGLDQHNVDWFAHLFYSKGFNAVKLHFSHAAVLANGRIGHASAGEEHISSEHSLLGLSYIEMLLAIASAHMAQSIMIVT